MGFIEEGIYGSIDMHVYAHDFCCSQGFMARHMKYGPFWPTIHSPRAVWDVFGPHDFAP